MRTVLVTGFEPFGGESINPSLEAVKKLSNSPWQQVRVVSCTVPVVRYQAAQVVIEAIEHHQPDLVIMLGQAAGRHAITPERIAINLDDFRIADNAGNQPVDQAIDAAGPAAYFSTLPVKAITKTLQDAGIPCQISHSAGTYVCNHLFYSVQRHLEQRAIRSGFVHIPLLTQQAVLGQQPSMSLETIVHGLKLVILAALEHPDDIALAGGTIC